MMFFHGDIPSVSAVSSFFFLTCVSAADRNEEMKKSILAVCLGLAGFWSVLAEDSPIAAPGRVNEQGDAELPSGELLSDHVAEAEFTGIIHRKCRFLTSLCPDKCDHARDFAVFRIVKYLDYRKPGKYGDEKQDQLMVDVNPAHKPILQSADILKKISALKPGDKVVLHWAHYYMHRNSSSFPERPVISVEPAALSGGKKGM
mgnify:CR=1 FL=1